LSCKIATETVGLSNNCSCARKVIGDASAMLVVGLLSTRLMTTTSFGLPTYWKLLASEDVQTIFVTGTGGGFDFVHSLTLLPELLRLGKRIVIGSYSFGSPEYIHGSRCVYRIERTAEERAVDALPMDVHVVDALCEPPRTYGPEVGLCGFLDQFAARGQGVKRPVSLPKYTARNRNPLGEGLPDDATTTLDRGDRWWCYAYNARAFTVAGLHDFYTRVCNEHQVDAILCIDGGSDSLMAGDENGLGDPIEDAVTIAAVSGLTAAGSEGADLAICCPALDGHVNRAEIDLECATSVRIRLRRNLFCRVLVTIGLGCDRFNGVSDSASFRAIAELGRARVDMAAPAQSLSVTAKDVPAPSNFTVSGFLGSMALEPGSELTTAYRDCVSFLEERAHFRSVIANSIVATSAGGAYGSDECHLVSGSGSRRVTCSCGR
jgi:hypothetical protein